MKRYRFAVLGLAIAVIAGYTLFTIRREAAKVDALHTLTQESDLNAKRMSERMDILEKNAEGLRAQVDRLDSQLIEAREGLLGVQKSVLAFETQKDIFLSELGTAKSELRESQNKSESGLSELKSKLERLTQNVNHMLDSEGVRKVDLGRIKV